MNIEHVFGCNLGFGPGLWCSFLVLGSKCIAVQSKIVFTLNFFQTNSFGWRFRRRYAPKNDIPLIWLEKNAYALVPKLWQLNLMRSNNECWEYLLLVAPHPFFLFFLFFWLRIRFNCHRMLLHPFNHHSIASFLQMQYIEISLATNPCNIQPDLCTQRDNAKWIKVLVFSS